MRLDPVLLMLATLGLTACDQAPGPAEHATGRVAVAPHANIDGVLSPMGMRIEEAKSMIQEARDDLAEDRVARARIAMDRLRMLKVSLPLELRAEIDRLDAFLSGEP